MHTYVLISNQKPNAMVMKILCIFLIDRHTAKTYALDFTSIVSSGFSSPSAGVYTVWLNEHWSKIRITNETSSNRIVIMWRMDIGAMNQENSSSSSFIDIWRAKIPAALHSYGKQITSVWAFRFWLEHFFCIEITMAFAIFTFVSQVVAASVRGLLWFAVESPRLRWKFMGFRVLDQEAWFATFTMGSHSYWKFVCCSKHARQ